MLRTIVSILVLSLVFSAALAQAEDCESSCPEGEVLVGFVDGSHTSCKCYPQAEMVDVVPEESQCEGGGDCG